jgi:16S rRNA processing protein RimM
MTDGREPLEWDEMVLVGRIARPHGIRGQVIVTPETDFVDDRFQAGGTLWCKTPSGIEPLTIDSMRVQKGRPIVGFEGFARIEDAERLAGAELRVPEHALRPLADGAYYHHQLIGCVVDTVGGERVGDVVGVEGGSSGSLLEIEGPRGQVLIPFAVDICVEIDVQTKRIRIDPPEGLLDVNEIRHRHDLSADD